jgi:hypothetical protein
MRNKYKDNIGIILFNKDEFETFDEDLKHTSVNNYKYKEDFNTKYGYKSYKCMMYGELKELFKFQGYIKDKEITRDLNIAFENHSYECFLHNCKHKTLTEYVQCFITSLFGDIKDNEDYIAIFKQDIDKEKMLDIVKAITREEKERESCDKILSNTKPHHTPLP